MKETNPPREEALFELAVAKADAAERAAFLDGACRDDAALRARLDLLLEGYFAGAGFLTSVPARPEAAAVGRATLRVSMPEEPKSRQIGRYKLLEQVGEGGFGEVWMAEQREPVKRRVALKLIKLGMDSRQVVARFEAERQALALMDHPNIARIFDAGMSEGGRPYFVMELVRGVKITDYCDQAQLGTRERLDLFIRVCQAIQHAHQKGVIHRDIKPSNILVTLHDGVPVPKVIDFGIAKATQQELTDKTMFTQLQQFIGTPAYISPEQAEMSGLDIDTRADIYSLGVLLYELLIGQTPFDAKEMMKGGIDALRRVIREQEPQRPSTKLNTLPGAERTTAGKRRQTEVGTLVHQLKGDLDWIVMKCLEKDRSRRYDSATGLAADLQRHLGNEPILARPPSAAYKFQKALLRNRLAFATAATVALALVLGVVVSAWQAARAQRARAEAEAVTSFLTGMFASSRPGEKQGGREVKVADILDTAVASLQTNLTAQPAQRARLQATLGETYLRLGLARDAIPLQEAARNHYLNTFGPEHPESLKAVSSLAESYELAGRREEALTLREATSELCRKGLGPEHPDTLRAMHQLARSYAGLNRWDETLRLEETLLPLAQKVLGPGDLTTLGAMNLLGAVYQNRGRLDESIRMLEKALPLIRKVQGPQHPNTLNVVVNLADAYSAAGRLDEAVATKEEALALSRTVNGAEHWQTCIQMGNLSLTYWTLGRRDAAIKLLEEMRTLAPKAFGSEENPQALQPTLVLAELYRKVGRANESMQLLVDFRAVAGRVLGAEDRLTIGSSVVLADCYVDVGRQDEALKLREAAQDLLLKVNGPEHPDTAVAMGRLAKSYYAADRRDEALKLREAALTILRRSGGPEGENTVDAMTELAISLQAAGRTREAIALDEPALRLLRAKYPGDYETRIPTLETLILGYDQTGRKPEADGLRKELADVQAKLAQFQPAKAP